ncbi:phospholipase D-like domain-containing protein [Streptosporangium canum]|uniref:phospholipase D-like domain-containing protein n=1 Tax=Streptosporangium canum TaxID=324952 RepID=UPI000B86B519
MISTAPSGARKRGRSGPGGHRRGRRRAARWVHRDRAVRSAPPAGHVLGLDGQARAGGSVSALHAKLVAAGEDVALLGSANLTDRALANNLEVGVVLRDPDVVRRLVRHFRALMRPQDGPLRPTG